MRRRKIVSEEDVRERLRRNVRKLRNAASLTANEAASRAGMNLRQWQRIEAGEANATLETLSKLGLALGVDPASLIDDDPSRNP